RIAQLGQLHHPRSVGEPVRGAVRGLHRGAGLADVRNVFALTSVLEGYGMEVLYAEDGQAGIDVLHRNPDVAVVLMDVMMPGLDGYATTAAIREMPQFAELPIIVITAKVMKGDREKSLESGASDYVPKPVDVDHLLDVMRRWLQPSIVR
uniref:response regulator n=1 Tax=Actinomadura fibrosa TaxID=111802 RepID=UPI001F5EBBE4